MRLLAVAVLHVTDIAPTRTCTCNTLYRTCTKCSTILQAYCLAFISVVLQQRATELNQLTAIFACDVCCDFTTPSEEQLFIHQESTCSPAADNGTYQCEHGVVRSTLHCLLYIRRVGIWSLALHVFASSVCGIHVHVFHMFLKDIGRCMRSVLFQFDNSTLYTFSLMY